MITKQEQEQSAFVQQQNVNLSEIVPIRVKSKSGHTIENGSNVYGNTKSLSTFQKSGVAPPMLPKSEKVKKFAAEMLKEQQSQKNAQSTISTTQRFSESAVKEQLGLSQDTPVQQKKVAPPVPFKSEETKRRGAEILAERQSQKNVQSTISTTQRFSGSAAIAQLILRQKSTSNQNGTSSRHRHDSSDSGISSGTESSITSNLLKTFGPTMRKIMNEQTPIGIKRSNSVQLSNAPANNSIRRSNSLPKELTASTSNKVERSNSMQFIQLSNGRRSPVSGGINRSNSLPEGLTASASNKVERSNSMQFIQLSNGRRSPVSGGINRSDSLPNILESTPKNITVCSITRGRANSTDRIDASSRSTPSSKVDINKGSVKELIKKFDSPNNVRGR
ncbi:MAG: hypothetical protein QWI36_03360 [Wolbachia endosymbiont of Tyrophagus putrescentiae]|nr:hypothetical protein [Wolbachia endosymbiont of Tyrophagus putrescentiae]